VDTAAMHLAAASQCPTVALFGPSPVFEYHPWKVRHQMIRPQDWLGEAAAKTMPREELMREIPLDQVLTACREAWESPLRSATANFPESDPA
jgi:ADP-heptose:LPS heptosyltransferase